MVEAEIDILEFLERFESKKLDEKRENKSLIKVSKILSILTYDKDKEQVVDITKF